MKNKAIGILMDPSPCQIYTIIGILKTGAYFVPLSSKLSVENLQMIISETGMELLITDNLNIEFASKIANDIKILNIETIDFEDQGDQELEKPFKSDSQGESDLCYAIYTSGSTGVPKGIAITNNNLAPLLLWAIDYFSLNSNIKVLHNLSISFDFGIFEMFTSLISGGEYHIIENFNIADLTGINAYINSKQINFIHSTPTFIKNLVLNGDGISSLDKIHLGGEEVSSELVHSILKMNNHAKIYNGYGPTECTINSTIYEYNRNEPVTVSLPIGKPTANSLIYILNDNLNLVPVGVIGEICIGGDGVVNAGYISREELSKEKFFVNPFVPGEKIYRTGDLAKWLPNGDIDFIGRKDEQVKIRGFRVELGEIETALSNFEKIKSCIVLQRRNANGDNELIAYFISQFDINIHELHTYLIKKVPNYMLPGFYVKLDEFPLTPNGKIDKSKLMSLQNFEILKNIQSIEPRNEIEEKLVDICQEILNRDGIGVTDDLFELGGDSIKLMRIILAIRATFSFEIHPSLVLNNLTIENMAELIQANNYINELNEDGDQDVIIEI